MMPRGKNKRDFRIDQQLPRLIMEYTICPFYATQRINPFINLGISANYNKVKRLSANSEILIKRIVSQL